MPEQEWPPPGGATPRVRFMDPDAQPLPLAESGETGVVYEDVSSSNVRQIGYREETRDLFVLFINGGHYVYHGVPPDVWRAFQSASSKGKFLHAEIKGQYPYEKLG